MYCERCGRRIEAGSTSCGQCGHDASVRASLLPPPPPRPDRSFGAASGPKRSPTKGWRVVATTTALGILVVLIALGIAASREGRTDDTGQARPTLASALRITDVHSISGGRSTFGTVTDHEVELTWDVTNTSSQDIAAWQATFDVTVTDVLGRAYKERFIEDCTHGVFAQGEERHPTEDVSDDSPNAQQLDEQQCTAVGRTMNPFIDGEVEFWQVLRAASAPFTVDTHVTAVTFVDGTRIGKAI
jgi:hypothetical protein